MGAFIFLSCTVLAQEENYTDTLRTENLDANTEEIAAQERVHDPRLATIMSALVPGLGQAYNKKYWKIPFIYGGGLALYYAYDWNNSYYYRFKTARENLINEIPIDDPQLSEFDEETLKYYQSYYRKYRDLSVIGLGLLYFANVIDAMVDGYLYTYDISDDLSLFIEPTIIPPNYNTVVATSSPGITLGIKF